MFQLAEGSAQISNTIWIYMQSKESSYLRSNRYMPYDQERNSEYQPQYLYIEDYPLHPDEIKKRKCEEQDDEEERGIIVIEIL